VATVSLLVIRLLACEIAASPHRATGWVWKW